MTRSKAGFTLVEVLVAVMVLGVGITAMAASAATVTRMIGRGQKSTRAVQVASQRLEKLRLTAYSTTPKCTAGGFASGTAAVNSLGITEAWTITANGAARTIVAAASYRTARGTTHADTLQTVIEC